MIPSVSVMRASTILFCPFFNPGHSHEMCFWFCLQKDSRLSDVNSHSYMFIAKHMIRYPPFVTHGVNISDTKKDRLSKKLRNLNTFKLNDQ